MILFKEPSEQRDFARLNPKLKEMALWAEEYVRVRWGDDLVVTSMIQGRDGVHSLGRGIDYAMLINGNNEEFRDVVNKRYVYDPNRPHLDTVPPLDHGTAPHHHHQVWIGG